MKSRIIVSACVILAALCSCGGGQKSGNEEEGKTLVLYYSQTGATKAVAEEIGKQLEAEVAAIEAEVPYDGDYSATVERWKQEKEAGTKVGIKPLTVNLDDYETIFLGYPVWGGTVASPVATFLADNSLKGKKIVTFATFGSGGLESSTADVAAAQPEAQVVQGYGVRNARVGRAPAEIERFLIENGFKTGLVAVLPDYSESVPVTEQDVAIFNQACGDYQFPLGTPVSVEKRSYDGVEDYRFTVKSQSPEGNETASTIYVIVAEGEKPVFTRVVR